MRNILIVSAIHIIVSSSIYVCYVRDNCNYITPEVEKIYLREEIEPISEIGIMKKGKSNQVKGSNNFIILFDYNSSEILNFGNDFKAIIIDENIEKVSIKAYTDSIGSVSFNKVLSEKRAYFIESLLLEKFNISPVKILVESFGLENPIESNKTEMGRSKNRRVVIEIVFKSV